MKIDKLKKELAQKQADLATKKAEVRSFTESDDKTIDDVKAGMADIQAKEAEIEEIRSNIEVLEQASGLSTDEKRDEEDLDDSEIEENAEDETDEDPEDKQGGETIDEVPDDQEENNTEKRDAGGMENMKLKLGGDVKEKQVVAFADYLKTGEVRDVTGIALKDGAVIIPETILTPEKEVNQFPRLGSLVRTVAVTTTTGKLPIFMNSTDALTEHTEYAPTDQNAKPEIKSIL